MDQDATEIVLDDGMPERFGILDDIRIAEEQIARGEGVEHDAARAEVLSRLDHKQR
jgi:hypothetical protein